MTQRHQDEPQRYNLHFEWINNSFVALLFTTTFSQIGSFFTLKNLLSTNDIISQFANFKNGEKNRVRTIFSFKRFFSFPYDDSSRTKCVGESELEPPHFFTLQNFWEIFRKRKFKNDSETMRQSYNITLVLKKIKQTLKIAWRCCNSI